MSLERDKHGITSELERSIRNNTKIILYGLKDDNHMLSILCDELRRKEAKVEVWLVKDCRGEMFDCCRLLSKKDMDVIAQWYHLYEFTDKIIVLSDNTNYPSMMNYVSEGILTQEEMIEALLCK